MKTQKEEKLELCKGLTFINKWGSGEALYGNCALAVDSGGNIYVADFNNNRIQKFNSSGIMQNTLGARGSGDGQFEGPSGIAIDSSGYIYVVDSGNDRIQKFNSSGVFVSKWGAPGSGDGQLSAPEGIAIDSSGNIYVTDQYDRIQVFAPQ